MPDGTEETKTVENNAPASEDLEAIKAQLEAEKTAKAALEEAMAAKDAKIVALEGTLGGLTSELEGKTAELDASITELAKAKEASEAAIGVATGKYREALIEAHPNIPQELIAGNTVEELFNSVEKGKAVVESVKKSMETQAAAGKVPAGAPTRGVITTEGMSPREMIAAGITQKGGTS